MTATVRVIGAPLDLGQAERGTDVGPAAIRYAGLRQRIEAMGLVFEEQGNLEVPVSAVVTPDQVVPTIARVCGELSAQTERAVRDGALPLTLGGDHSVAIGSVSGVARAKTTGLLWVDAHGDFNTPETSPSGNVHGMPLAVLLKRGDPRLVDVLRGASIDPQHVALVGIRSLDARERNALKEAGVSVFTMRDIDERGMGAVAREAVAVTCRAGHVHLSLDIDALDPTDAPGVATPSAGGLSYREAHLLMEILADAKVLRAMDVVEVNPMLDVMNRTAKTAVDLVASALGQSIL